MGTVRRATLANGLQVIAHEMPHLSYVSLRLVVGAGSRDDPREKAGISHFVEHVLFRGTERHPHENAVRAQFAAMGARWNAQTAKEFTSLDIDVPKENVAAALEMLADILLTPTFNGFEVERRIVMEEMNHAYDEMDGTLWPFHLFADARMWPYNGLGIPTIGEPRTVMSITLDDVKQYLAHHYRAGGMALGMAGAFELDALLPAIDRLFSRIPPGMPERLRKQPLLQNGAMAWLEHPNSARAMVRMMFPFIAPSARSFATAIVTDAVLTTDGAGRIASVLRSRAGLLYTGDSDLEIYTDCARSTIVGEVKKEHLPQMVGTVARMLRDLRSRGPTEEELAAARLVVVRNARMVLDIAEHAAAFFAQNAVLNRPPPDAWIELAPTITMEEVIELARSIYRTKHALIAVAAPRDDDDQRAAWQMFESALGD